MKTAIRDLYEQSVFNAWKSYDDEVRQIYASYTDAFELGRVEKDDKTFQWKNVSLVKAWEKRDKVLKDLWTRYQATNDHGLELKAIIVRAVRVQPCVYIPQTDSGSYLVKKINCRSPHACYEEIENYFKPACLYTLKIHDGFLVLIADDDVQQSTLFTLSPLEAVKV